MAVTGGDTVRRNYRQLTKRIRSQLSNKAITEMLISIQARAAVITPVDTSNLINSQFRILIPLRRNDLQGRVGYTANYAFFVHDPEFPMRFKKAAAEKEFLLKGAEQAQPEFAEILRRNYSL